MIRKIVQIAFYEARMSCRGWRFWLLLALTVGISLFARRDYLSRVKDGLFLHSAFSFQHPSFWLMLSILGLGASALALDICGRLRSTRMDKILFPLPIRPMELMIGRLLGVMIIMIPLSFAGIFSLALWQYLYGHGAVVWQPFLAAFLLLVLPLLAPIAALAITMRTFFKHDFAALIIGGLLGAVLAGLGLRYGVWIDVHAIIQHLVSASPTLGVRIPFERYWLQLSLHGLLSLAFLSLAPLYLRRQEPQRWVIRRDANKWVGFSSLLRVITNLKVDRHLGWGYRLTLVLILVSSSAGVLWAAYRCQDYIRLYEQKSEAAVRVKFPTHRVDVLRYQIELIPNSAYDRLDMDARLTFTADEASRYLAVELDRRFLIDEAFLNDVPCSYSRQDGRIRFNFAEELESRREHSLRVRYHGAPTEFHPSYTALQSVWYPSPWRKIQTDADRWVQFDEDLFDAEINLVLRDGVQGAFAGELVDVREKEGKRIEQWRTLYPVPSLQLFWGKYACVQNDDFDYRIRFFHLPSHEYQARVYMEEVKEQQEYVHEKLGELPFPQLTLIESPYSWTPEYIPRQGVRQPWIASLARSSSIDPMPGVLLVSENHLRYMHEQMWLMERFDHNPFTIPFYQLLPHVLREVHDEFYNSLISAYFDHSIHPVGEMAFWMNNYLSSYASKLLERNSWRRRRELDYDVGASARRPIVVARSESLLSMHKSGEYPELEQVRGEALFRMLHHLMGDKTWWAFLRELFQRYRFQEIPLEDLLPLVQQYYGGDLMWYVQDWIAGTALPEYEITLAEARIVEDDSRSGVKYETMIRVKNHGTGKMAVPIYMETEMDYITRDLWLDSGEEKTLIVTVPHRPIFAMVDPEKWILQLPFLDEQKKTRGHSERRVLIEGEDNNTLRANSRRGNRRHFWHHH